MKTKRLFATMTAILCAASTGILPQMMLTNAEEIQNRDQVYESSLILPAEIIEVLRPLNAYLWDSEHNVPTMDAYTARNKDGMIEDVCGTEEILETVKTFIRENGLNENLIVFRIETSEERQMDGETGVIMTSPIVPDTPETTGTTIAGDIQNRDKVYEPSLILPEEIIEVLRPLNAYLWDSEHNVPTMNAYTTRNKEGMIEVVCGTEEILETVKAFVCENGLNENLIVFRIETPEERQMDGETSVTMTSPVVPDTPETTGTIIVGDTPKRNQVYRNSDELEMLVQTKKALDTVLYQNGFTGTKNDEDSAYVSIFWDSHTVSCSVKSEEAAAELRTLMQEDEIPEALVTLTVLPEFDYRQYDGGQRSYEEINNDAIFMYLNLKKHLQEDNILSNICLTKKMHEDHPEIPYTAIDIFVKAQEDADALNDYMREQAYWTAIITVTVQPDLSAIQESASGFQTYVCLDGDSNDDGNFSIADIVKLDRYLIADGTMNPRQATASDLNKNGVIDAGDMTLSKRMMIQATAK